MQGADRDAVDSPPQPPGSGAVSAVPQAAQARVPAATGTSGVVIIVDDDEVFSSVLANGLARHGFVTRVAADHGAAIGIAREDRPSHAVLDLKLGEESGLELIRPLLELREDMRILVLTGFASIATAVNAIKLGAANYLAKPVDMHSVLGALTTTDCEPAPAPPVLVRPSPKRLEWEYIQHVLDQHDGNISATARALNMHRRTLQRKLAKRPVRD